MTDTDRHPGDREPSARPPVDGSIPGAEDSDDDELVAKVPWHFWVGVVAMVVYLGWRLLQGIIWIF